MCVDFKNGFNLENPITNESVDPYSPFFETPCIFMHRYIGMCIIYAFYRAMPGFAGKDQSGHLVKVNNIHNLYNWRYCQSIYKFGLYLCLFVCLGVCLFVSNKRQNGWTDRAQIFCRTSRDHREGLWIIRISKICLHKNSILMNFLKFPKKILLNPRTFLLLLLFTRRKCSDKANGRWVRSALKP